MARSIIITGIAAAMVAACQPATQKADTSAIEQEILAQEEAWNRAYANRDAEALAGFLADDAAMASPGEQLIRGKDSIREATQAYAQDPNLSLTFRANRIQVAESGDLAYTRGQYMLTTTDPATEQPESSRGHYLTVWQRQADGSWKAVEDFITPGPPPPVSQGAAPIL